MKQRNDDAHCIFLNLDEILHCCLLILTPLCPVFSMFCEYRKSVLNICRIGASLSCKHSFLEGVTLTGVFNFCL
jgi:hypothetical protein